MPCPPRTPPYESAWAFEEQRPAFLLPLGSRPKAPPSRRRLASSRGNLPLGCGAPVLSGVRPAVQAAGTLSPDTPPTSEPHTSGPRAPSGGTSAPAARERSRRAGRSWGPVRRPRATLRARGEESGRGRGPARPTGLAPGAARAGQRFPGGRGSRQERGARDGRGAGAGGAGAPAAPLPALPSPPLPPPAAPGGETRARDVCGAAANHGPRCPGNRDTSSAWEQMASEQQAAHVPGARRGHRWRVAGRRLTRRPPLPSRCAGPGD